jgi:hypothetical protein
MNIKMEILLATLLFYASNALAVEWYVSPNLNLNQRYTDNLRLLNNPTRDNWITTISPSALLGYIADNNELRLKLNWNQLIYDNESDLNFSEKIINLDHSYSGQRWSAGISGRYGMESSFGTQLEANGSGNLLVQVPRFSSYIAPRFSYILSERNSIQINNSYTDVRFGKTLANAGGGFANYTNEQLNASFIHQYLENLSLNLSFGYSVYDASSNSNVILLSKQTVRGRFFEPGHNIYTQSSDTLSYQLGFNYSYDPLTTLNASVGLRSTSTISLISSFFDACNPPAPGICQNSENPVSATTNGKIYSLVLTRQFERGNVNISYNQQLSPASTGSQQQVTQYSLGSSFEIDERSRAGINGTYLISSFVTGYAGNTSGITNNNRDVLIISPSYHWRWTEDLEIDLSYTYVSQVIASFNQSASSDSISLQLNYQPQINRMVK